MMSKKQLELIMGRFDRIEDRMNVTEKETRTFLCFSFALSLFAVSLALYDIIFGLMSLAFGIIFFVFFYDSIKLRREF